MVQQVLKDYPDLKVKLYIGMALEGISINDHKKYIELMENYEQLNVYYKIKYPLTHIKLYEFELLNKQSVKYIGSANFSKAGFLHNQELLLKTKENFDALFNEIDEASLLCTTDEIDKHIIFFNEEKVDSIMASTDEKNETPAEGSSAFTDKYTNTKNKKNNTYIKYNNLSIRRFKHAADADFRIPTILKHDIIQDDKGINAWVRNQTPYLRQYNKFPFTEYFPVDTEFTIITDKGEEFKGKLTEGKPTQLEIYPNVYEYFRKKLSITERRPIEYIELFENDLLEIWVTKMGEEIYYFDFSPKNVDRRRF